MGVVNQIIAGDFIEIAAGWPSDIADLTITSPPYGLLRSYHGYTFDHRSVIKQLYRVTKPGGVVVWVVGDETINGSESGAAFEQALHFKQQGFLLHDTMLYQKHGSPFPARRSGNRYSQVFEFMFVFSKNCPPKTAKLICDKENRWAGHTDWGKKTHRRRDGTLVRATKTKPVPDCSPRTNIWMYRFGGAHGQCDKSAYQHPATFPFQLAIDHIKTWSNPSDLVLDPLVGSGTTCIAAKVLGRTYIGVDVSSTYCELARLRLAKHSPESYQKHLNAIEVKKRKERKKKEEVLNKLSPKERELLGFPRSLNMSEEAKTGLPTGCNPDQPHLHGSNL